MAQVISISMTYHIIGNIIFVCSHVLHIFKTAFSSRKLNNDHKMCVVAYPVWFTLTVQSLFDTVPSILTMIINSIIHISSLSRILNKVFDYRQIERNICLLVTIQWALRRPMKFTSQDECFNGTVKTMFNLSRTICQPIV